MKAVFRAGLLLVAIVAVVSAAIAYSMVRNGFSARAEPHWVEARMAQAMRYLATPSAVRSRENPVQATPAVFDEGLEHFADHCAVCHANDGSGDTPIGRSLYPPAPDMRGAATQDLTDGELFSIIENGIRLTGMPAWSTGTEDGAISSWTLVHFVRRLPDLTPNDIARMETLNPRSPEEFRQEEAIRRFLDGEEPAPAPPATKSHEHAHQ